MKPGSVLVDIAVDQGGCFEDTHATTHADPTYQVHDSIFYCVANMPGAVPNTSTYALTNATLPYAVALADKGWQQALPRRPLARARPQHPRRPAHQRAGRRGRRDRGGRAGRSPCLTRSRQLDRRRPRRRSGRPHLPRPPVGRARARGQHADVVPPRPAALPASTSPSAASTTSTRSPRRPSSAFLVRLREGDAEHPPLSSTSAARTVVAVRGFHKFAVARRPGHGRPGRRA